jgi:glycerophosphoryl diester phosphodiesterase
VVRALGAAVGVALAASMPLPAPAPAAPATGELAACIRDSRCHRVWAVAHRGEGFGHPPNSRAAVTAAVAAGVPVVEIDLRQSRDREVFVFHDARLEGSTTGSGRIETLPAAEVARARLHNGEPLPRFPEIYAITRGRALLSVDFKTDPEVIEQFADWLRAHGSFDDMIFFVNTGEEMAMAARVKKRYPEMIVMVRLLDTRVTVESTRAVFGGLPEIFHTDLIGADEVARLHALGPKVYVNGLPLERRWQPFRYFAVRSLLTTGVDFILTNEAVALMRRLSATASR